MNYNQFLARLYCCKNSYKWELRDDQIVGVAKRGQTKGCEFSPIEAVYRSFKYRIPWNEDDAAQQMDLPKSIVEALNSTGNRGNVQVVRGKIKQILFRS